MTPRERFLTVLNGGLPPDRLPMVEWAAWWDKTLCRWQGEGLPRELSWEDSQRHFGLDVLYCLYGFNRNLPRPASPGAPLVADERGYEALRPLLYADDCIAALREQALALKPRHDRGEIIIRLWLDGYFWFPRKLLGIEPHLYAFYDRPELLHRINADLADFHLRVTEGLFGLLRPDMVGYAEDMSYNLGPMLSRDSFDEFLLPYYRKTVPQIQKHGVRVLVDSDGDISAMIPWLLDAGLEGAYPLERQAGVDVNRIRAAYPSFILLGGYDKMVMPRGEAAMREEFKRLLPAMRAGRFIPSVDHQTPPGVSLENYRVYVRLFREYCEKAVGGGV